MRDGLREERAGRHPVHVSSEVLEKLKKSREKARNVKTRTVKCPICGELVRIIPVDQKELMFVKCNKCKFTGVLDPAYFRRQKRKA